MNKEISSDIEDTIFKLYHELSAAEQLAVKKNSVDYILHYFLLNDKFSYFAADIYNIVNANEFKELWTRAINNVESIISDKTDDFKVNILNESTVVATCYGKGEVQLKNGNTIPFNVRNTLVFVKVDEAWKIVHSHSSAVS